MKQIRVGVFETNSSSTHSLVFCTEEQSIALDNEELFFKDQWSKEFISKKDALKIVIEEYKKHIPGVDSNLSDDEFWKLYNDDNGDIDEFWRMHRCEYDLPVNLEQWIGDYLESDTYSYVTPSGDKIYAIAKYGYDG